MANVGGGSLAFLYCSPPRTPPTTAAAIPNVSTNPKINQKCIFFNPHILLSRGSGGTSAAWNTPSIVLNCGVGGSGLFGEVFKPYELGDGKQSGDLGSSTGRCEDST